MAPRTLLLTLLAIGIGCSNDWPTAPTAATAPTPATPPRASSPAPAGGADACADLRRRFDAVLAKRTDVCATETDCGCYNPVGGPHLGCGGVTDAATVVKLSAIEHEYHAKQCAWTHNCAAWACTPRCVNQRCTP